MPRIRASLLTVAGPSFVLMGAASASDLPVKGPVYKAVLPASVAPYFWTGCHIGGKVGGGWPHDEYNDPLAALRSTPLAIMRQTVPFTAAKSAAMIGSGHGCSPPKVCSRGKF